ncbi:hypothetical protein C8F01DRAFT_1361354 [Mycena amicta]|nr:hypothetical protein C8F01DRAFT_1361354 [Mycena amicta]
MADTVRDASAPFSPTADQLNPPTIILRSCNGDDFYAHKLMLEFAVPFFQQMLAMPEPVGPDANPQKDGKPVVNMPEHSAALEKLLIMCYPRYASAYLMQNLDGVLEAYKSAKRYDISEGPEFLEALLLDPRFLKTEPGRVYAIGCLLNLRHIVEAAVAAALQLPVIHPRRKVDEFDLLPARQLWKLYDIHHMYCSSVRESLRFLTVPRDARDYGFQTEDSRVWWPPVDHSCPLVYRADLPEWASDDEHYPIHPAPWYVDHIARLRDGHTYGPQEGIDIDSFLNRIPDLAPATLEILVGCPQCLSRAQADLRETATDLKGFLVNRRNELVRKFMQKF